MIPTAKQFFKNEAKKLQSDWEDVPLWMIDSAIEFTKVHCIEQARIISKKAKTKNDYSYCGNTGSEYPPDIIVDKDSILNAYNLNNIK